MPQMNVLKTGRKEPLRHDDPAVQPEVEEEQDKIRQERAEKQQARAIGRKEFEELQQQLAQIAQAQQQQLQQLNFRRNDGYQNRSGPYNGQGGQFNRGFNNRGGYQGNQGPPRGFNSGPRPFNPNYNNNFNGNYNQQGGPPQQGGFRQPAPQNSGAPPPNDRGMPRDIRRDYGPPQPKYTPSAPLGQTPSQPAPKPSGPATMNQHTTSTTQAQTDDAYAGIDKSVFPDGGIYSSSSSGSQA